MPPPQALTLARSKGLDLVEISPTAVPPVCRIMDFGKYQYEQQKRARAAKQHQRVILGQGDQVPAQGRRARLPVQEEAHRALPGGRRQGEGDDLLPRPRERAPGDRPAHPGAAGGRTERGCRGRVDPQKEGNQLHTILAPRPARRPRRTPGPGSQVGGAGARAPRGVMPKLKTHRGAAKRFKKTGTGKFVRAKAFKRHILTSKPTQAGSATCAARQVVSPADAAEAQADAAVRLAHEDLQCERAERCTCDDTERDRNAPRQERNRSPRQAQEAAEARQGVLRHQEQAVPGRPGSGRQGAQLRLRRPPAQEARLPPPVGRPDQRRRPRQWAELRPADQRTQGRRRRARPEEPRRTGRQPSGRVRAVWPSRRKAARPATA